MLDLDQNNLPVAPLHLVCHCGFVSVRRGLVQSGKMNILWHADVKYLLKS